MNLYPNNPHNNPITKSDSQIREAQALSSRLGLEKPVLEWALIYLNSEIASCDSISKLNPDFNNPASLIIQIKSLQMLKERLIKIKSQVEERMKIIDGND